MSFSIILVLLSVLGSSVSELDDRLGVSFPRFDGEVRDDCKEQLKNREFCVSLNNYYDDRDVNSVIENHMNTLRLFNESNGGGNGSLETRAISSDNPSCVSRTRIVRPIRAKNMNGEFKILNSDVFYQYEVIEECEGGNTQCSMVHVGNKYEAICKQLYTPKKLIAVDSKNMAPITQKFLMPSGCECHTKTKLGN